MCSSSTPTECRHSAPKWTGASHGQSGRHGALPPVGPQYVNGYREGGNANLGVHRDRERPTFVANEFRSMIDRLPRLAAELPDLTRYLLATRTRRWRIRPTSCWQETQFGLRPTVRISHLVIQERPDQTVVASKMLACEPLLLDCARTSRPAARSGARTRILAGDGQSQPVRRFERIHRPRDSRSGAEKSRTGRGRRLAATKTKLESKEARP